MTREAQLNAEILVVDDSASDRALVGGLVSRHGWKVAFAEDGRKALDRIEKVEPTVVLTDLRMPELDGLQLVAEVRRSYPRIPVILMTAVGSESIASEALRLGAASYVPKQQLAKELSNVLTQVLTTVQTNREAALETLFRHQETHFELSYEPNAVSTLVNHIQQSLLQFDFCGESELIRIAMALTEALNNAVEHGNLEMDSELRDEGDDYARLRSERIKTRPYRDRTVRLTQRLSPTETEFRIRDEGKGFDPSCLPDPTDPENLMKTGGRGILLIRTFMDEVRFNTEGNEITMIKRRVG